MDEECCEVVITAADADWLAGFTRALVEDRLAACGHVLAPIRSLYRWDGVVHDDPEARVGLHTRRSLVSAVHGIVTRFDIVNVTPEEASGPIVSKSVTVSAPVQLPDGSTVNKGGQSTVTANLKPGTYQFYCPVDGHAQAGMQGTLTVK